MGQTGRPDKRNSHLALTLLGTVQASRAISHPPRGFALVCSVLLPITQIHNKETSEGCPDCGNIPTDVLESPSLTNKLQVPHSSLLP